MGSLMCSSSVSTKQASRKQYPAPLAWTCNKRRHYGNIALVAPRSHLLLLPWAQAPYVRLHHFRPQLGSCSTGPDEPEGEPLQEHLGRMLRVAKHHSSAGTPIAHNKPGGVLFSPLCDSVLCCVGGFHVCVAHAFHTFMLCRCLEHCSM
jgi:hypothetical protein